MKKIAKFGCTLLAICSIASCATKCDYAKFVEKAKATEKSEYTKAVVKGTWKGDDGEKTKLNKEITLGLGSAVGSLFNGDGEAIAANAVIVAGETTWALVLAGEVDGAKYYAGSSFKYVYDDKEDGKATYTWNKYGLITSIQDDFSSVKITYKK